MTVQERAEVAFDRFWAERRDDLKLPELNDLSKIMFIAGYLHGFEEGTTLTTDFAKEQLEKLL